MNKFRRTRSANDLVMLPNPGPYLAKVVSQLDQSYHGGLLVQLLKMNEQGDYENELGQLFPVQYCSPFYGVTPLESARGDDGYENTQQSYGFWAVPPDVGTKVLVIFAESRSDRGFWIGCVADENMNFMVPDGRASTEITTPSTPADLKGKKLPVGEYNKHTTKTTKLDTTISAKPYNKDFTEILQIQGLLDDESRGTTTSSARRELPSAVYGMNTPGPIDKRRNSPEGSRGPTNLDAQMPYSRLGGSSFVMDDGDDKFIREVHASDGPPLYINKEINEPGGDNTIPQNELIRLRTRTGHQILLHNSEDLIYIANSRGTAWIELTSDGKIDIHAQDSISVMSDEDINFTAERDFNIEAGRNINMKASARWSDGKSVLNSKESGRIHLESQFDTNMHVGKDMRILVVKDYDLSVGDEMKTTVVDNYSLHSKTNIYQKSDNSFHQTSGHSYYLTSEASIFERVTDSIFTQVDGTINVKSTGYISFSTDSTFNTRSELTTHLESNGNFNILSSGAEIYLDSNVPDSHIYMNSQKASVGTQPGNSSKATVPTDALLITPLDTHTLPYVFPGAAKPVPYESILTRAPQHEPWSHHENQNPQAFKPEDTDREDAGELPSNDRIITPDTFLRNVAGRRSSGYVYMSGGAGLGATGSHDTAIGGRSTGSPIILNKDIYVVGDSHGVAIKKAGGFKGSPVNGATTAQIKGQVGAVPSNSTVVVSAGNNDFYRTPSSVKTQVQEVIDSLKEKNCFVIFVVFPGPIELSGPYADTYAGLKYTENYNDVRSAVASVTADKILELNTADINPTDRMKIHATQAAYKRIANEVKANAPTQILADALPTDSQIAFNSGAQGPLAKIVTKKRGLSTTVAAIFQPNFQGFIDALEDTGYEIKVLGGYANRNAVGQSQKSYHASGAAIDINPSRNGYYKPARRPVPTDMPANTGDIARRFGLGWGGEWRSCSDAMHFSAAKREGGAYNLPRNGLIPGLPPIDVSGAANKDDAAVEIQLLEDSDEAEV